MHQHMQCLELSHSSGPGVLLILNTQTVWQQAPEVKTTDLACDIAQIQQEPC